MKQLSVSVEIPNNPDKAVLIGFADGKLRLNGRDPEESKPLALPAGKMDVIESLPAKERDNYISVERIKQLAVGIGGWVLRGWFARKSAMGWVPPHFFRAFFPAGVKRYFCNRLLGLSGMVYSIKPASIAGAI